jgi:peptide-methionine (S)-S-oxide reductase
MTKETVVFGGGCFWCTEAVFKMLKGVESVVPGYSGGQTENPTYYKISNGDTGHAEVIKIEFDPAVITFEDLLTVFFASHDPTTLNRQGNDIGTQYRSIILYTNDSQREVAHKFITTLNASSLEGTPIVTDIVPLEAFYEAEAYHHDYYANNKTRGYCEIVINPKLQKVQEKFAELIKNQ